MEIGGGDSRFDVDKRKEDYCNLILYYVIKIRVYSSYYYRYVISLDFESYQCNNILLLLLSSQLYKYFYHITCIVLGSISLLPFP